LRRVTIVAARADTAVLVQADYETPSARSGASLNLAPPPAAQPAVLMPVRAAPSTRLGPLELYARTQRGLEENPKAALLDVLA